MTKIKNIKDIKDMKEIEDINGRVLTEEELKKISGGFFDIICYCPECGTEYSTNEGPVCEKCNCDLKFRMIY